MPRFSANLGHLFTEYPLIERIGAAAKVGFKAIELQLPYELAPSAVKAELDRHRLTMLNINSPQGPTGEPGLAAVAGREREFATLFTKALDYVTAIGGTSIHVLSGLVPPNERPAAERVIVSNLTRACDEAAAKNIFLMLEPLNQRDRPGYFVSHIEHIADIIAKVGKPNLKIMYDFYHVQVMQGDVLKRMEAHFPLIGHVQFAGPPDAAAAAQGRAELSHHLRRDRRDGLEGLGRRRIWARRSDGGQPGVGQAVRHRLNRRAPLRSLSASTPVQAAPSRHFEPEDAHKRLLDTADPVVEAAVCRT